MKLQLNTQFFCQKMWITIPSEESLSFYSGFYMLSVACESNIPVSSTSGPLFIKRTDVLPQDLVKSPIGEIRV